MEMVLGGFPIGSLPPLEKKAVSLEIHPKKRKSRTRVLSPAKRLLLGRGRKVLLKPLGGSAGKGCLHLRIPSSFFLRERRTKKKTIPEELLHYLEGKKSLMALRDVCFLF